MKFFPVILASSSSSTVASGTPNNIEEIEGTTTTPIIKGIDLDKLQDKAVIAEEEVEEEVEEQQQQETAENTTLNQASGCMGSCNKEPTYSTQG